MRHRIRLTFSDEVNAHETARQCDETFLDNLLNILKKVDIHVIAYMSPIQARTGSAGSYRKEGSRLNSPNPLEVDRNAFLESAVLVLRKIIPEVQRLGTHSELFSDELSEAYFLEKAGILAYRSRELLDISDQLDKLDPSQHKDLDTAAAKRSADPRTGVRMQPWETFAGPMAYGQLKKAPFVTEMQTQLPDMLPIEGQALPAGAVMIAEHNRQREDWYIRAGNNMPADIFALQHGTNALLNDTNIRVGVEAFVKRAYQMPAQGPHVSFRRA